MANFVVVVDDDDDTNCYVLMLKHTLHAYQIDKNCYGKLHKTKMLIRINENIGTNASNAN